MEIGKVYLGGTEKMCPVRSTVRTEIFKDRSGGIKEAIGGIVPSGSTCMWEKAIGCIFVIATLC